MAEAAEYPIMEKVASNIVQKYQQSSCEQLWQERMQKQGERKPEMEERAIKVLRKRPANAQCLYQSAPIANKLFECGMIP